MKILAFVDMHGDLSALIELKKKAKKADIIVCAGDLTIFENDIDYFLLELNSIGKPVLMIHGNHESLADLKNLCEPLENLTFIHKKLHKFQDFIFVGYGGGGFSITDPAFENFFNKNKSQLNENVVLVTHAPPYGTKLDKLDSEYYGNKSIMKFIKRFQPRVAVGGHFHENSGAVQEIGKTLAINPGPDGMIIEV